MIIIPYNINKFLSIKMPWYEKDERYPETARDVQSIVRQLYMSDLYSIDFEWYESHIDITHSDKRDLKFEIYPDIYSATHMNNLLGLRNLEILCSVPCKELILKSQLPEEQKISYIMGRYPKNVRVDFFGIDRVYFDGK